MVKKSAATHSNGFVGSSSSSSISSLGWLGNRFLQASQLQMFESLFEKTFMDQGISNVFESDGGPQFASTEFQSF